MAPISTISHTTVGDVWSSSDISAKAHARSAHRASRFQHQAYGFPGETMPLAQLASTVHGAPVSKRAANDDKLWPRKHWDSKVALTLAQHGLNKSDCAELRYGNPQDKPIDGIVDVFVNASRPPPGREVDWFAYSTPDRSDLEAVASRLSFSRGVQYSADDVIVTDGSLTALDLLVYSCTDPGDEIIVLSPVYFNYPVIIHHRQAVPIVVPADPDTFEPDINAIREAITPRTKGLIINSPNNPTGVVYSRESLIHLAKMLTEINAKRESPVLVISDEAYSRIIYDNVSFTSVTTVYPYSAMTYTTGKTLLAPGQRLGYIAISPLMPKAQRHVLRRTLTVAQNATWGFPASPLLHSLDKLDTMSIDIPRFQRRRDFICDSLAALGYRTLRPTGTFYICVSIPTKRSFSSVEDQEVADEEFCIKLAAQGVLVMPGALFGWPGMFRISVTANEGQLEHAVQVLANEFHNAL